MAHPPFTCRNTLERLRERNDEREQEEQETNRMKIVRVEYIVALTGEDGKTELVNKERILSELDSTDPEHIKQILEQELPATDSSSLVVTNITELQPTGDDDQM